MTVYLYNADCLDEFEKFKDGEIDLIVIDPPYGISNENKITRKETTDINMDFGEWDHFETEDEFITFTNDWFYECMRILKKEGWMYIFFGNTWIWILQTALRKHPEFNIIHRTTYTWLKTNPAPSYRKFNWRSSTEPALVFSKGKCRIPNFLNQTVMKNYGETPCRSNYGTTGHPTEKPVDLLKLFVETSSNVGDTVLDCFMGSGSTGVACIECDRHFIGIEKSLKWYTIAKERLDRCKVEVKGKQGDSLLL